MRISDWSSDVCSSDLDREPQPPALMVDRIDRHRFDAIDRGKRHRAAYAIEIDEEQRGLAGFVRRCVVRLVVIGSEIRSEEHTSELQSLMRISYAVFCLKKKNQTKVTQH